MTELVIFFVIELIIKVLVSVGCIYKYVVLVINVKVLKLWVLIVDGFELALGILIYINQPSHVTLVLTQE